MSWWKKLQFIDSLCVVKMSVHGLINFVLSFVFAFNTVVGKGDNNMHCVLYYVLTLGSRPFLYLVMFFFFSFSSKVLLKKGTEQM